MASQAAEFHLDEIDRWRSGEKATPGMASTGERYALAMREAVKHHAAALRALGVSVDDQGNPAGPSPGRLTASAILRRHLPASALLARHARPVVAVDDAGHTYAMPVKVTRRQAGRPIEIEVEIGPIFPRVDCIVTCEDLWNGAMLPCATARNLATRGGPRCHAYRVEDGHARSGPVAYRLLF